MKKLKKQMVHLDFVGIFSNVKALAFDSEDVKSVIHNIDILKENFKTKIRKNS